jgi:2-keto-4-pentenoate hydratase
MHTDAMKKAAQFLWKTRLEERRIEALPEDLRPEDLAAGYAIQKAMLHCSDQPAVGWKIAATSAAGQRHIGVTEPLAGRLFRDFVLPDGAHRPAASLHMRVAEPEFAFRMARDLPARESAYTAAEVCEAVGAMHLAIEIPDARFEKFDVIGPAQIAADDAFAAWFVLGAEVSGWRDIDLPNQPVRALKNGTVAAEGSGANALGDPRLALTWLANHLSRGGDRLKAGDVITTGTCTNPVDIASGDTVIADFGALGQVRAIFD